MKKSLFNAMEIAGIVICMAGVSILRNVYVLSGGSTAGVLFGSVNTSIWEQLKPIILCYILYGITELMCVSPCFRQFVCAKAIGLYISLFIFILLIRIIPADYIPPVTFVSLICGFITSKYITLWEKSISHFFAAACFMLLLIFIMYFSFSAFPPRMDLFLDKESGMYGIVPEHIDIGAEALSIRD